MLGHGPRGPPPGVVYDPSRCSLKWPPSRNPGSKSPFISSDDSGLRPAAKPTPRPPTRARFRPRRAPTQRQRSEPSTDQRLTPPRPQQAPRDHTPAPPRPGHFWGGAGTHAGAGPSQSVPPSPVAASHARVRTTPCVSPLDWEQDRRRAALGPYLDMARGRSPIGHGNLKPNVFVVISLARAGRRGTCATIRLGADFGLVLSPPDAPDVLPHDPRRATRRDDRRLP